MTNIIWSLVSFQTVRCPKNLTTLIANDSYHPITCEFSNNALSCKSFHIHCNWLMSSDHLWFFKQCVVFPHSLQMIHTIRSLVSFQTMRCLKNHSTFIANDSYHLITCDFSNSALSFHIHCKWFIPSDHMWVFKQCVG